jgi:iron complex transport system substrate-binding protein
VGGNRPALVESARGLFFSHMPKVKFETYRFSPGWPARDLTDSRWRRWGRTIGLPLFLVLTLLTLAAGLFSARLVMDQTGRRVSIPEHPERLVSLAPSITETLYALGLGDQLVGDTDYCEYPPEAKRKPHVGPILNPSLERIVALKPDLVLGSPEANRIETANRLERLGIPLYGVTARTVEETLHSIEDLGRVLGREAEARGLVQSLRRRIEAVESRVAGRERPKVLFVVWYRPLTTVGARSFIGDVIRRAGGASISEDLQGEWPRLSLEEALRRDPDVILFPRSESFAPALEEFQRLPGWRELRAVRNRRMYFVSDAIVRPSPRLVDALEEVARALHPPEGARQEAER